MMRNIIPPFPVDSRIYLGKYIVFAFKKDNSGDHALYEFNESCRRMPRDKSLKYFEMTLASKIQSLDGVKYVFFRHDESTYQIYKKIDYFEKMYNIRDKAIKPDKDELYEKFSPPLSRFALIAINMKKNESSE